MKKSFTLFALFLGLGMANAQTDWQKEELKGKVKELSEKRRKSMKDIPPNDWEITQDKTLVFNLQGYKTKQNNLNYEKRDEDNIEYEYDAKGKLTAERSFSSVGHRFIKGIAYSYDKKNNLTSEITIYSFGEPRYGTIYTYDRNNNLLEKKETSGYGTSEEKYKYNSKNQKIEENTASWIGRYRRFFEYDTKGNIINKHVYKSDVIVHTVKNKYADNGKISEETTFSYTNGKNPKKTKYQTYKYDLMDNLIEYIYESDILTRPFPTTYKYEYDTSKNWIKREKYEYNKLKEVIVRKIVYFD